MTIVVQLASPVLIDRYGSRIVLYSPLQLLDGPSRGLLDDACLIIVGPVAKANQHTSACPRSQLAGYLMRLPLRQGVLLQLEIPDSPHHAGT